jgi:hypothetical protein
MVDLEAGLQTNIHNIPTPDFFIITGVFVLFSCRRRSGRSSGAGA